MNAQEFILSEMHAFCREHRLDDIYWRECPTWSDGRLIRDWLLRLQREDTSGWSDFLERLASNTEFADAVRSMLIDRSVVIQIPESHDVALNLPSHVGGLSQHDGRNLMQPLNPHRNNLVAYPHSWANRAPDELHLYTVEDEKKFIPPSKKHAGEIMFIEMKPGLSGPARIGRVRLSRTRKTLYYKDLKLQSLKGTAYKANYYEVESAMWYWVSKCRQDGNDTLYPGIVEIDDDVREEYWTAVRRKPENKHLTKFRSEGKYSKRKPN